MVALLKMPSPIRLVTDEVNTDSSDTDGSAAADRQDERRVFPRKECRTRVKGKRLDHTLPALQQPVLNLALRDLSLGGLSAVSGIPLERGERVTVFFPPQGIRRGWDACGRVLRCEPSALGYRVALEFDPLPAA